MGTTYSRRKQLERDEEHPQGREEGATVSERSLAEDPSTWANQRRSCDWRSRALLRRLGLLASHSLPALLRGGPGLENSSLIPTSKQPLLAFLYSQGTPEREQFLGCDNLLQSWHQKRRPSKRTKLTSTR
ncbi:hypothetical protein NDU88_003195 [Pleurodeles waltl]|uniref:Uncharacterized protein n=1 Tax=Pleurodeles waltl TaxID=8319 RepID=A0AAV7RCG4_PLEWA|nr:hypothetical protein NDU88_003195 [Pleurodeles waltl]